MEQALSAASNAHDFKLLVAADGRKGTTMEDVGDTASDNPSMPTRAVLR
jgi:hypothetical protein